MTNSEAQEEPNCMTGVVPTEHVGHGGDGGRPVFQIRAQHPSQRNRRRKTANGSVNAEIARITG